MENENVRFSMEMINLIYCFIIDANESSFDTMQNRVCQTYIVQMAGLDAISFGMGSSVLLNGERYELFC